jgi:hypothetical protein
MLDHGVEILLVEDNPNDEMVVGTARPKHRFNKRSFCGFGARPITRADCERFPFRDTHKRIQIAGNSSDR